MDGPGFEKGPGEAFGPVQTGVQAHSASRIMGTEFLPCNGVAGKWS